MELAEAGPTGDDDWDEVRAGLKLRPAGEETAPWFGRAGAVWLRAEGEPEFLDGPGDYGGLYLGAGLQFALAPAWRTGPEVTVLGVDAEGSRGGSGVVAELAWRFTWQL
jgi:hypothetical protein